jgi:UDP-N-acetylmuramate: L-alanyl-gamma-D-glutamyl-meso-diaminopimelate ligase
LERFNSVKRRMEVRGVVNGITVYDDFAHHPTAIERTITGLRGKIGNSRILAVLEPRSNTMKLGIWKDELAASLNDADLVFAYTSNLGWDVNGVFRALGGKAATHDNLDRLVDAIAKTARSGDHVLMMSNGGFGGIHEKLLAALQEPR